MTHSTIAPDASVGPQTLVLLRHTTDARLPPLETLGFLLTLLAPAVTPLFALSERWNHLPCGCFIHCRRDPTGEPKGMKAGLRLHAQAMV